MTVVLVADDDADIRDLVAFKLEQSGLEVIAVEDGQAALEQARARRPTLAVLDVSMPGLSGIDVCRMLRADPATADMLIIMLTARVAGTGRGGRLQRRGRRLRDQAVQPPRAGLAHPGTAEPGPGLSRSRCAVTPPSGAC
ncbi:hypothetical protein GCM10020358_82080 [Amorphoplanes nipponensis]|uniref:response regulator n=1 Tax=Actinoplanes nipponensis TaxID=135950 RepID=UPI0031E5717F